MEKISTKTAYFESKTQVFTTLCVALAGWLLNEPLMAMAFFVVVVMCEVALQGTMTSMVAMLFFGTFLFPNTMALLTTEYIISIVVAIAFAVCTGAVWRVFYRKRLKWDSLAIGLACMAVATLFGGGMANIGSAFWLAGFATSVGLLVGYLLLKDIASIHYIANTAVGVAVLLVVQTIIRLTANGNFLVNILYKNLNVGWGVGNNIALVLLMCAPFILYCAIKAQHPSVYITIYMAVFCTVMFSFSRGCILILVGCTPLMLAYVLCKTKRKAEVVAVLSVIFIAIITVIASNYGRIKPILEGIADKGLTDNGRFLLWEQSITDLFGGNIAVGRGFLYGSVVTETEQSFRWYHCSVLQMVSNFGVMGGIAFAISLATRYRRFFHNNSYSLSVLLAMFMAECYGFIDVTYFTPYYLLPLLVITSVANGQKEIGTFTKEDSRGKYGFLQKKANNYRNNGNNIAKSGVCGACRRKTKRRTDSKGYTL